MKYLKFALSFSIVALVWTVCAQAQVRKGSLRQLSVGANNTAPAGVSGSPALAINGKKLAFSSTAENILSSDENSARDVFVVDLENGQTSIASLRSDGAQADDDSTNPAVSPVAPDGFFVVAFESVASNLGRFTDTSGNRNIYIRLPTLGVTELISFGVGPSFANGNSRNPSVTIVPSPNKAFIVFESDASNLVANDTNNKTDVFLVSIDSSNPQQLFANPSQFIQTRRISQPLNPTLQSNGNSEKPKISGDGKFVVFNSSATNLVSESVPAGKNVYLYEVSSGKVNLLSKGNNGLAGNGDSYSASISYRGRFISYLTEASSIAAGASSSKVAVVVHDTLSGSTARANSNTQGIAGDGSVRDANISANGRFVSFSDDSSNLVTDDSNSEVDVFIKDLFTGDIDRVSVGEQGNEANAVSDLASVAGTSFTSLSGILAFRSFASNLFANGDLFSGSDILSAEAEVPAPALVRRTPLEVPPDATVIGRRARLNFESFATRNLTNKSTAVLSSRSNRQTRMARRIVLRYDVRVKSVGRKTNRINIRTTAKRNQIAINRLPPGNYTANYRAIEMRGAKIISASRLSPIQRFSVAQ